MNPDMEQWKNVLDPKILKSNLEFIALYIALYERLEDTIISRIIDFYSVNKSDNKRYHDKVLELYDPKKCPKINNKSTRLISSLIWLLNRDAITDNDILIISNLKTERNKLTHEMFDIITLGLPKDIHLRFLDMIKVFNKIEKWWIVEVEIPTSYDFEDVSDIDFKNVMSGNMCILQLILNITQNGSNKDFEEICKKLNIPVI